jgi:hypothetical protein
MTRGEARHVGDVGDSAIRDLRQAGTVRFVVADLGSSLRWLTEAACFDDWEREIQPHLALPGQALGHEHFPGEYTYFASQSDDGSAPIVLLAKTH